MTTETQLQSVATYDKSSLESEQKSFLPSSSEKSQWCTSAYWNVNPIKSEREHDDVPSNNLYRFDKEISRKLQPILQEKTSIPRTLDYNLCGMHLIIDDGNSSTGGLNASQKAQLIPARASDNTISNMPEANSVRAAEKYPRTPYLTTTQDMSSCFSDDVLEALKDGMKKREVLENEVANLKALPFTSKEPRSFEPTSRDYRDWSNLSPDVCHVTQTIMKTDHPNFPTSRKIVYNSRYNNVTRNGPLRRKLTSDALRNASNVDEEELEQKLSDMHLSALPQNYKSPSSSHWISTTHEIHKPYAFEAAQLMNTATATSPDCYSNEVSKETKADAEMNISSDAKDNGKKLTEYTDSYQNRFSLAITDKTYAARSVFNIEKGGYTIFHHYHHPRSDIATQEEYSPSEIVPGQYTSMLTRSTHARNKLNKSTCKERSVSFNS